MSTISDASSKIVFRKSGELMAATPYAAFQHICTSRHVPRSDEGRSSAQYVRQACSDLQSKGYAPNSKVGEMLVFGAERMLAWAYSLALNVAFRLSNQESPEKTKSVGEYMFAFLDEFSRFGATALTYEERMIAVTYVLGTLCSCISGCYPYNPPMPADQLEATFMKLGRFGRMHPDLSPEEVEICILMMGSAARVLHTRTDMSCSG